MPEPKPQSRLTATTCGFLCLALFVATILVYAQCTGFDFLTYDDGVNVYRNPLLNVTDAGSRHRPGVPFSSVVTFWKAPYYELYTPITYTVWAICAAVGRLSAPQSMPGDGFSTLNAGLFHMVGVVFHALNVVLVYLLLGSLLTARAHETLRVYIGATLGALLFALHPLQVEAVAWVTGNNNLFSATFVLLALLALCSSTESDQDAPASRRWLIVATFFYVCALLAKPTAVVTPLMAAAMLLYLRPPNHGVWGQSARRYLLTLALWCGLAGACAIVTKLASSGGVVQTAIWVRPFLAGDALAFYLGRLFWPNALCVDYGHGQEKVWSSWWGYVTWLVPAAAGFALWRLRNWRGGALLLAGTLFVAGVFPMLGFVPYYYHPISTVADRYLYLSLIGPAFALAALLSTPSAWRYRTSILPISIAILVVLAFLSVRQCGSWRNTETFARHTLTINPKSWRANGDLANALLATGRTAEAVQHYRAAHEQDPEVPTTTANLGIGLLRLGEFAEAEATFRSLLPTQSTSATVRCNLSAALSGLGRHAEAVEMAQEAVRLKPDFWQAHYHLGIAEAQSARSSAAVQSLRRATELAPTEPSAWYWLARVQSESSDPQTRAGARLSAQNALRLAPDAEQAEFLRTLVDGRTPQTAP